MAQVQIGTWNLWNHEQDRVGRLASAIAVIGDANPDVLALQEVQMPTDTPSAAAMIAEACGYPYRVELRYPDDSGEGLAVLSRVPMQRVDLPGLEDCALRVECSLLGTPWALTTVHLDWQRVLTRERQIADLVRAIAAQAGVRYEVLAGDFNATPESSIYQFLRGQMSIAGDDTIAWLDLAARDAARSGSEPMPTLDVLRNPRWHDLPTLERPMRLDWILMRDLFNSGLPWPRLERIEMLGEKPAGTANLVASDHYGLLAVLEV